MFALLLIARILFAAAGTLDVSALKASEPALVCELDMKVLKGELRRLSWSVDGRYLHVQTLEAKTLRDYIVTLPEGEISAAFGEPEWAVQYWTMKSALAAPGVTDLKIEVLENHQRTQPMPFTGGFANGGAQTVDPHNPRDTFAIEARLLLLDQEVGYTLNAVAMAGGSYGWGPPGSAAIAFIDTSGHVTLFDRAKHRNVVATAKSAMMPAWSADGRKLAYVQKASRDRFRLMCLTLE
ncbi:MAG TPA: hypothetical protein VKH42_08975 [Vicinamibacterales bacterium]|nr:hypothetical protein [Vicinamibacterales bacterium]